MTDETIGDRCWYCGGRLIWDNDFDYADVYGEGKGIVTYLHCTNCEAIVEYSIKDEDEESEEDEQVGC